MSAKVFSALIKAKAAMGPLFKNATNPAFRSKYADLAAIIDVITEPLCENGLVVYQTTEVVNDRLVLITTLAHESGESIAFSFPILSRDSSDPQKVGSALTYSRRYALLALMGLAPEDDDGNAASGREPRPEPVDEGALPATAKAKEKVVAILTGVGADTEAKQAKLLAEKIGTGATVATLTKKQAFDFVQAMKSDPPAPETA